MQFSFKRSFLLSLLLPIALVLGGCQSTEERIVELKAKAEKGDVAAMVELGEIFYGAQMVDWSDTEGAKWMKMAAEKGNAKAQHMMGIAYSKGLGVPIDRVEAHKWAFLSSCKGFVESAKSMKDIEATMSVKEVQQAKNIEKQFEGCTNKTF